MPSEAETQKNEITIGLDLDERSVKIVVLSHSASGASIDNYAVLDSPQKFSSTEETSLALKKIVSQLKLEGREVFAAISGSSVYIRRVKSPKLEEVELRQALKLEAKNLIPLPIDSLIIDYRVMGETTEGEAANLDILMLAVQQEAVRDITAIIEKAGLKLAGLSIIPFAIWDLIKTSFPPEPDKIVALIDFGADTSSINIFKNNILQFSREINTAGSTITKSLTGSFFADKWQVTLSQQQAENIKIKYGIPKEDDQAATAEGIPLSQIRSIMKPVLRRLQNEIQRSFDYYKDQFLEEKIDLLYLTGGAAQLKNLAEFIAGTFGVEAVLIDPLKNISVSSSLNQDKLAEDRVRLAVALALALGKTSGLNLLFSGENKAAAAKAPQLAKPAEKKVAPKFSLPFSIPVPAILSVSRNVFVWLAILLFILGAGFNIYLVKARDDLKVEIKSKEVIIADLEELKKRQDVLRQVALEETKIREVLGYLSSLVPRHVVLTRLSYDNQSKDMFIAGQARGTADIGIILTNIESSPYFEGANLEKISGSTGMGENKLDFSLKFRVARWQ